MDATQGIVLAGMTAGGVLLTREVLKRVDLHGAGDRIARTGTDVAERTAHVMGGMGRGTGDVLEKVVGSGGRLLASGTGTMVNLSASVADRLLFVRHAPADTTAAAPEATAPAPRNPRPRRSAA